MLANFKDEDFDNKIKNEDVSVIQFSAEWCGPCKALKPVMDKLSNEYMSFFKDISTLTIIDIPNQPNSIKGGELKDKLNGFSNINYKESIEDAIKSIPVKKNDIILITGSLYLAGEVLNLN